MTRRKRNKPRAGEAHAADETPKQDAQTQPEGAPEPEEPAADEQAAPAATPGKTEAHDERYLRLRADFENFRARMLREKTELYRRANEDLMLELLPVMDHMDLALQAAEQHRADGDPGPLIEGFAMVRDQLLGALGKFGLAPVEADGETFDPNLHEAISHIASQDVSENGVVAQTRRGYKLGDRLLRPAQVAVSSGPPAPPEDASEEA
jgi:molecular chaperone GrpE